MVPNWDSQAFHVAWWDRFGYPDKPIREGFNFDTWWVDAGQAAATDAARAAMSGRDCHAAPMAAYLIRRLLLVIPTLFGIIAINFAVMQFAPGGPVEQMIAELRGQGDMSLALGRRQRPIWAADRAPIAARAGSTRT